jgi:hypothetical protein
LLRRAGELATWVGERRAVTEDGDLTGPDAAAAAALLGVDQAGLLYLWEVALATDLVVISEDDHEADGNPDLWPTGDDAEDVGTWTAAFTQALVSLDLDAELAGEEDLAFESVGSLVLPMFLVRSTGVPSAELRDIAKDLATEHLADDEPWDAWVAAHGDPATVLLDRLAEHGAVEVTDGDEGEVARLTPLGMLAMREELVEGGVEIPVLPPVPDMTAADLLSAAGGVPPEELAELTEAWLAAHGTPARDLLEAATEADPEGRIHAATVLAALPDVPWRTVLDDPVLRPYARQALDEPLDPADTAWLLVDRLAATADVLGDLDPDAVEPAVAQTLPAGQEQEVLASAWRVPHPDTFEVLTLLGAHHPDKHLAKAARTAAHKARSAT